jgi:hypothetical protein
MVVAVAAGRRGSPQRAQSGRDHFEAIHGGQNLHVDDRAGRGTSCRLPVAEREATTRVADGVAYGNARRGQPPGTLTRVLLPCESDVRCRPHLAATAQCRIWRLHAHGLAFLLPRSGTAASVSPAGLRDSRALGHTTGFLHDGAQPQHHRPHVQGASGMPTRPVR